jgi:uncharacterized protein (TIGR03663 family)
VSTTSTKSRADKKPEPATEAASGDGFSVLKWRIAAASILVTGAFLRLYDLGLVPFHHDEGVNGNFLMTLVREGPAKYQYNPENYHGPTLYFISAIIPWLSRFLLGKTSGDFYGLNDYTARGITVAFGVATIWLALLLRKRLGAIGALSAAGLIAISPGAVYLSRYFIHESLFVFFTLGIVVAALKYYDTGRAKYLILTAISAALMVATKETWVMNGPVLLIALITTNLYCTPRIKSWLKEVGDALVTFGMVFLLIALAPAVLVYLLLRQSGFRIAAIERVDTRLQRFGGLNSVVTVGLVAFAVFIIVNVLFYSSFFTNYPKGVNDSMQALKLWRHRTHEHAHPFLQYFEWLRQIESPLLLLGVAGSAIAVWRGNNRFVLFAAQWAFGLLVAYSLVEYKTPWIALNFIIPLAIVSGYALEQLYRRFGAPWVPLAMIAGAIVFLMFGRMVKLRDVEGGLVSRLAWNFDLHTQWPVIIAILLLSAYAGYVLYSRTGRPKLSLNFYLAAAIALGVLGYQMYQVNFVHYDDDQLPYVYAHTKREMLTMVDQIDRISKRLGTGNDTGIALVSPDYWPLPWYFRNYKRVGYYQQIIPTNEPLIIGSEAQAEQLKLAFGDRYQLASSGLNDDGSYPLRPGVDLLLYVRKDVAR